MPDEKTLPSQEQQLRAPHRRTNPFHVTSPGGLRGSSGAAHSASASGSGSAFVLQGLGTLAALALLGATFWIGSEFGQSEPADLIVAERACSRAVIGASALPQGTIVTTTEAAGSEKFWRLSGYARVMSDNSVQEYKWTCGYYIGLGVSRVLHLSPPTSSERITGIPT